jgi:phosphoribosylglycinamide formyltransferase-1
MHLLEEDFVRRYEGRLMNVHPSLLPAFPGLHSHRKALLEGVKIHGCTVHFVTPSMDHGPIIVQAAVAVMPDDTEESLAARVLRQEHCIYPRAVRWFMEGRLKLSDNRVYVTHAALDDSVLYSPGLSK